MPMLGFADPVFAAQSAFRTVMDAFARPGRIVTLASPAEGPAPLSPAAATIALTLFDHDSPVLIDAPDATEAAEWIRFHTGAPIVRDEAQCAFAIVTRAAQMPSFERFNLGSDDYPDRSTTVIVQVETLTDGAGIALSGPGIRDSEIVRAAPLPADFAERLSANRVLFPRGVDLLLVCGDAVVALPRSVRVNGGR